MYHFTTAFSKQVSFHGSVSLQDNYCPYIEFSHIH